MPFAVSCVFLSPTDLARPGLFLAPGTARSDASSISVKSTPDGAEIEVDGKYVGSTPSTLQLKAGDHRITIRKPGFAVWERTITLSPGGAIVVDATLEKTP